jgi:cell division protein FtsQ
VWNSPRLLNSTANALFTFAALIGLFAALQLALRSTLFPLREVSVHGAFRHAARADVEAAARLRITGNLFSVDLEDVRKLFEGIKWVRRVDVRRAWPDGLAVHIEEHVALARWGGGGLVNSLGERFSAASDERLPIFNGPPGTEAEVTRRYRNFAALLAPLHAPLTQLTLTPRFAWELRLDSGLQVMLGRDAPENSVEMRLARFVNVYPRTLARVPGRHEYVDLRYPNGFALRLPDADRSTRAATRAKG